MILSKRTVILLGVACIFFFAFLNRINLMQKSEVVAAYAQQIYEDDETQYFLSYIYKEKFYRKIIDNDIHLKDETTYPLLIVKRNPANFVVFNFWGFVFTALLVACLVSSGWLVFAHAFFEKVAHFKFSLKKEHEIEE